MVHAFNKSPNKEAPTLVSLNLSLWDPFTGTKRPVGTSDSHRPRRASLLAGRTLGKPQAFLSQCPACEGGVSAATVPNQAGPQDTEAPSSRPEEGSGQGSGRGRGRHRAHPAGTSPHSSAGLDGVGTLNRKPSPSREGLSRHLCIQTVVSKGPRPAESIAQKKK